MAHKIILPKQGLLMTEGMITRWLVEEGGLVKEGEPLFEMETDKLTITMDATASGTLLKILHPVGDVVPVAEVIAIVGEMGEAAELEDAPAIAAQTKEEAPAQTKAVCLADSYVQKEGTMRMLATPRARIRAEELHCDWRSLKGSGPDGLIIERDVLEAPRMAATPLARKIAQQENVPLSAVTGSGARGKITADDVRASLLADMAPVEDEHIPLRGMRKAIAENMHTSLQTMAQANHRMQVDMTECVKLHKKLKDMGQKASFNDMVILCAARALKEFPNVNASLIGNEIVRKKNVHVGVAVAVEDGLIVPVIHNTDRLLLSQIAQASRELGIKAREGRLSPEDIHGGTFTVTNLGMYGVDSFTAIINPPEAAILAVGAVKKQAVVMEDDSIQARSMMWLSLTFDHRILDGVPAAKFLARIRELLENPWLLL